MSERFDDLDERHDDQCEGDGGGMLNCSCGPRQQRVLAELHALRAATPSSGVTEGKVESGEALAVIRELVAMTAQPSDKWHDELAWNQRWDRMILNAHAVLAAQPPAPADEGKARVLRDLVAWRAGFHAIDTARGSGRFTAVREALTELELIVDRADAALVTPATEGKAESGERIRVTDGVVAIYRPDRGSPGWPPIRNPWHCYNTYDGSFIECRTDEEVAGYCELPQYIAPSNGGRTSSGELSDDRVKAGYAAAHEALAAQPTAPADDAATVLAGLFGPEEIDAAARALCAEWVETQLKEPVRKFCEYDQLTTEGRDVWRRMARRAISAAQQRLADRGQGGMADEFEPYLAEAMKRPGFRAAYEAALRDEENPDG